MMNLYPRNNDRKKLLAATALVFFLFVVDVVSGGAIRDQVRAGASVVFRSVAKVSSMTVASGIFSSRGALERESQSLTLQLAQLQERAAGHDALKAENEQLRALIHLAEQHVGVTAPIVSSVRSSPYGTFLIGAGSAEGIVRGNFVLTSGGFVVGTVSDTASHTAVVAEVFAPGSLIEAVVNGAAISLTGSGGGNASAKVPRGLVLSAGDTVVAPSLGQRAIGIVGAIASSSAQATQDVFVRTPVNLSSLQYIYVISAH